MSQFVSNEACSRLQSTDIKAHIWSSATLWTLCGFIHTFMILHNCSTHCWIAHFFQSFFSGLVANPKYLKAEKLSLLFLHTQRAPKKPDNCKWSIRWCVMKIDSHLPQLHDDFPAGDAPTNPIAMNVNTIARNILKFSQICLQNDEP